MKRSLQIVVIIIILSLIIDLIACIGDIIDAVNAGMTSDNREYISIEKLVIFGTVPTGSSVL